MRLHGQAVKTPPFHGGIRGSIPLPVTIRALSSAGRASALQAECRRFDPVSAHHFLFWQKFYVAPPMARWFSWLECRPVTAEVVGSSPIRVAILPRQLSWQSKGLKILVSTVRFCAEAPSKSNTLFLQKQGVFYLSVLKYLKALFLRKQRFVI